MGFLHDFGRESGRHDASWADRLIIVLPGTRVERGHVHAAKPNDNVATPNYGVLKHNSVSHL